MFGIWQWLEIYINTLLEETEVSTLEEYLRLDLPHEEVVRIVEIAEGRAWMVYDSVPIQFREVIPTDRANEVVNGLFNAAWKG